MHTLLFLFLFLTGCIEPAAASPFYGGGGGGGGGSSITVAETRQFGVALDWDSATTIELQVGQRLADDDTTVFTVTSPFTVTFADIDTGSEANAGYYVWLTGDASAVLSLSETAPTGVSGAKYLAGWIYNDSGSDIVEFRSDALGDTLEIYWVLTAVAFNNASTQPTIFTEIDFSTGGYVPDTSLVLGMHLLATAWADSATSNLEFSHDGTQPGPIVYGFATKLQTQVDWYAPTGGCSVWYKRTNSTGAQQTIINVNGFRFDRSGV